jgi:hypothetical protein
LLIVAAPKLGLPRRPSLLDLASWPWIISIDGCGMRAALRRAFEGAGLTLNVAIEAPSAEFRLSLVARGVGIGITSQPALESSPLRGEVRVLEVSDFSSKRALLADTSCERAATCTTIGAQGSLGRDTRRSPRGQAKSPAIVADQSNWIRTPCYPGFQKVVIAPPATTSRPPRTMGSVGSVRKATKLITCQTTNSVAKYRPTT